MPPERPIDRTENAFSDYKLPLLPDAAVAEARTRAV